MKKQLIPLIVLLLAYQLILAGNLGNGAINFTNINGDTRLSVQTEPLQFNNTNAYNYIISQLSIGYRVPGDPAHDICANWIRIQLQDKVDLITTQNFTIQKPGQPAFACQNILGKMNLNQSDIVILGAHWDSRAVAEKDINNRFSPIPGANDGGSGVAVLIELARILGQIKNTIKAQIWFLFLDAEDQGSSAGVYGLPGWKWCEGSTAFTNEMEAFYNPNNESVECFILLDMVGGTHLEFVDETQSTDRLLNALFRAGQNLSFTDQFPSKPNSLTIFDDHVSFLKKGVPSADLIIDFSNGLWTHHHKHSDNLTNIDINSLNITGRTVEFFIKTYYISADNPDWGPVNYIAPEIILLGVVLAFITVLMIVGIWGWLNSRVVPQKLSKI